MIKLIDRNMDYGLVLAVLILMIVGILMIHSVSMGENIESSDVWQKQILWSVLSIVVMFGIVFIPLKFIYAFSYVLYGIGIVLLVITHFYGAIGGGEVRWLIVGPFRIQPSELMKIGTVLVLARYLSYKKNRPTIYRKVIIPIIIIAVPASLVQLHDLGTSLVLYSLLFPMLYWAGLDKTRLFFLVAPIFSAVFSAPFFPFFSWVTWVIFMFFLLAILYYSRYTLAWMGLVLSTNIFAGIAIPYIFGRLKPYRQKRLTILINPESDPFGSGYQIIQSKIALGSGGIFGKGLGQGQYTEGGFLPQAHTDFVFSVIGEELGFVGSLFILSVIFYIIYRGAMIAATVKNSFMSIAAVGISTIFAFHMFVNVGMVVGVMPVTGLPLLFISYGGSSCITSAMMIGLLMNFSINRHEY